MKYEDMSDFEINKRVAKLLHPNYDSVTKSNQKPLAVIDFISHSMVVDYCNNPSDAWPIMLQKRIGIMAEHDSDEWSATNGDFWLLDEELQNHGEDGIYEHTDKNPLRAAMIVYLMMQEGK